MMLYYPGCLFFYARCVIRLLLLVPMRVQIPLTVRVLPEIIDDVAEFGNPRRPILQRGQLIWRTQSMTIFRIECMDELCSRTYWLARLKDRWMPPAPMRPSGRLGRNKRWWPSIAPQWRAMKKPGPRHEVPAPLLHMLWREEREFGCF